MISLDYVKNKRGLPFVKRGMRVESLHHGKFGKIVSGNESGNLNIRWDGTNYSDNCHPRWAIRYFDKDGNVIKEFPK